MQVGEVMGLLASGDTRTPLSAIPSGTTVHAACFWQADTDSMWHIYTGLEMLVCVYDGGLQGWECCSTMV